MNKPELLAPAGSWEALVGAVENGADAVYLGGQMFSARQSANNFDDVEIARGVRYAHMLGVKIYVAVNILIADEEIKEAVNFLARLQSIGVDAVIIQDIGLACLVGEIIPNLPIHASTQLTGHNIPGVEKLMELGFSRIVLAREMTLSEIKEIKDNTSADIEIFVHGALCISYSGQCLISSMIGGRSGNRGRCAQPCRLQYELIDKEGKTVSDKNITGEYLLSPRDLNVSNCLPELIAIGTNSFKIEGRMKRPEYVATVTNIYRKLIDRYYSEDKYSVFREETEKLAQIFNRDFTPGYLLGKQGREMMSYKRPNNRGVMLGRIKGFDRETGLIEVALEKPLNIGDGIEVWVTDGGRVGLTVKDFFVNRKKVEGADSGQVVCLNIPGKTRAGDRVFKTFDAKLMKWARDSIDVARGKGRKIPILFKIEAGLDIPFAISAASPDGQVAQVFSQVLGQPANNRPLDKNYLEEQLSRLGNTPFVMAGLTCDIKDNKVIYPVSAINQTRRMVLEALESKILNSRRYEPLEINTIEAKFTEAEIKSDPSLLKNKKKMNLSVIVGDLMSLKAAVNQGADIVYFGSEQLRSKPPVGRNELLQAMDICRDSGTKLFLHTPRITKDFEIKKIIEDFAGINSDGVLVGNLGLLKVMQATRPELAIVADFALNAFNRFTCKYLIESGASRITLSPELTISQVENLADLYPVEIIVQGALELMISEQCLIGAVLGTDSPNCNTKSCHQGGYRLRDRTGALFPVDADRSCRMHLFNSRDLCLLDDLPELHRHGVASVRIEAQKESAGYVKETVGVYRRAIDLITNNSMDAQFFEEARRKMYSLSPAGLTKGHFYRGV
ncbi:MAG: peptidase U32 [Peptococcaceae bacterium]|nr:peptidase U32 [Peptococcaceae bacterium]